MAHSFLVDAGYWNVKGHWLKPNLTPITLEGDIQIAWKRANWFKMTTSLACDDEAETKIIYQCRGNLNYEEKYYTYVAQHSLLGNIEGEGRLGLQSIIQYYWFLGTTTNKKGLDTFYCIDQNTYYLTSNILEGHSLLSTIEVTLKR
ncbi:hypothetical protein [Pleurocapsa sp. FMAR1]|uniref:hypothetical protein n=1 Tax=Pleurocapsa sp. FMAR1 TaxID=3040204 RepID=UPI0029C80E98|nr:hypothetical protein [Pleurocapsa sp. FMAR1]